MKDFLKKLWFLPKENVDWIFHKSYSIAENYTIEVDFTKEQIHYWDKIRSDSKTTQNFSQEENWVVLECVNRLLEKWYHPADIILEKTFPSWHGTSGRLDILVQKDWKSFLMIECKTWGKEFEKEFKKMQKDWGQLFTYFQQDRDTDYLMLYTSNSNLEYKNEIIKIEDSYKETSNVVDLYTRWNKFTKQNWIFETWIQAYDFESKSLTYDQLEDIKESDASFIFNRFLEILRHNTVSDKPNAFNKMFTLFLCKIYDELNKQWKNEELDFQWKEWVDDHISFQKRLSDIYKKWMLKFLSKEITDFSDEDFNNEFFDLEDDVKSKILEKITKIRLQKSNEFAIKEVNDDLSFQENAIVLKEVVELLQNYKFRYTKKQPFLWEFFELLLTTGLKQEAGQFFTPVPITRFICRSIPIETFVDKKIADWTTDVLPKVVDYAAWSGHFLIEAMEEIQKIINKKDVSEYWFAIRDLFKKYRDFPYTWAGENVYWIEKDYRLVRTSKVGCYLNGDGIATVIHGDGLDSFKHSAVYKWDLKYSEDEDQYNGRFDLVLSNPPYSVSAFKGNLKPEHASKNFTLFNSLTDVSSEIEALFIERTAQLLKEWGIAGIILPSSILSNAGIYTKAREIILKNFDIVAITELWSNTFMATGTNTVVLFLRKRNKFFARKLKSSTDKFFVNLQDVTLHWVEKAVSKYINEVWKWLTFEDYVSMIQKVPNANMKNHEIFKEYTDKIKLTKKTEEDRKKEFFDKIIELEKEKLFYFVLSYPQKVVVVKSGERQREKEFLGYEFSTRKGNEGIHPIQRWKLIDECTKLFDPDIFNNPNRVSTYIYDAFQYNFDREISEKLKSHVFRASLVDFLTFDRADFEKTLSLNNKKKVRIESKRDLVKLSDVAFIDWGNTNLTKSIFKEDWVYSVYSATGLDGKTDFFEHDGDAIILSAIWARCGKCFLAEGKWTAIKNTIIIKNKEKVLLKYLFQYINEEDYRNKSGTAQPFITLTSAYDQKIPLPPLEIQQRIVDEIWKLEKIEEKNLEKIWELQGEIEKLIISSIAWEKQIKLWEIAEELFAWWDLPKWNYIKWTHPTDQYTIPIYSNWLENNWLYGFTDRARVEQECITISARWTIGFPIERKEPFYPIIRLLVLIPKKHLAINKYLVFSIKKLDLHQFWATTPQLTVPQISNFKIPLPPLELQKQIVSQIETIEQEIEKLKSEIADIQKKKKEILRKYL